jgi:hypothetical protein
MLLKFVAQFLLSGFMCEKKLPGLFLCNLQLFDMLKKQHFEIFSRVGLCDSPSDSLCLTFCEMAKSSHEQSARAMILDSESAYFVSLMFCVLDNNIRNLSVC